MSTSLRVAVALLLGALFGTSGLLAGAAQAAGSSCTSTGVDVVVDYGALGGGVARGCAPDAGGKTGDRAFQQAGYPLQYVPDQPGFVCAVAGKPAQCKMPGSGDPWWGVFWSDGTSGKWKTAMVGVDKLEVPKDGAVAIVWESGKKVAKPSVPAPRAADRAGDQPSATASATPLATAAKGTGGASGGGTGDGGGFPAWAVVLILVVVLGGGAALAVRRRGASAA
ncbi:MAG TPA: hypothetical protein VFR99_07335 [Marmoricola sp.]|nr:hypothetical protein [Marmoricola sp.]